LLVRIKRMIRFILCTLLIGLSPVLAKDHPAEKGLSKIVAKNLVISELPATGSFFTIQIGAFRTNDLSMDTRLLTAYQSVGQVYVRTDGEFGYFSIGLFNTISKAKEIRNQLRCVFKNTYVTSYAEGKRAEFTTGNIVEQIPSAGNIKEWFSRMLNTGYYHVQFGYYVKKGLEPRETDMYNKLAELGVEVIELKYKKGRVYVTAETYTGMLTAKMRSDKLDESLGRYTALLEVGKPEHLDNGYINQVCDCFDKK